MNNVIVVSPLSVYEWEAVKTKAYRNGYLKFPVHFRHGYCIWIHPNKKLKQSTIKYALDTGETVLSANYYLNDMNKEKETTTMSSENALVKAGEFKNDVLYKLRLSKLDPTQRTLQKEHMVDNSGFLTPTGAMAYVDYLFQKDTLGQKTIAKSLRELKKEDKKDCK